MPVCSPRRPDESTEAYFERFKIARDIWRREFVDNYYRQKESGTWSPNSDGFTQDEIAHHVELVEQAILIDAGQASREDFTVRREWPPVPLPPPGKSLSEISDLPEPRPYWSPTPPPPWYQSELSSLEEPAAQEERTRTIMTRRTRTKTRTRSSETAQAGPSTLSRRGRHRRKRGREEDEDERDEEQLPDGPHTAKRKRTDIRAQPPVTSGSKKRRAPGDEVEDGHEAHEARPGREEAGPKRRRTDEGVTATKTTRTRTTTNRATACPGSRRRSSTRRAAPRVGSATAAARGESPQSIQAAAVPLSSSSSSRVTRARRRQLSGEDAQLFQLGRRGEPRLQEKAVRWKAPKAAAGAAADRSRRRPANTRAEAGGDATNTTIGSKARKSTKSKAGSNTRVEAGGDATNTIIGSKARAITKSKAATSHATAGASAAGRRRPRAR